MADTGSPSPHGEGGLKSNIHAPIEKWAKGPSPHGEGGLKCKLKDLRGAERLSLPARGGWIEIIQRRRSEMTKDVPPRTGRVD